MRRSALPALVAPGAAAAVSAAALTAIFVAGAVAGALAAAAAPGAPEAAAVEPGCAEGEAAAPPGAPLEILSVRVASRVLAPGGAAGPASTDPKDVRLDEPVELLVLAEVRAGGKRARPAWYGPAGVDSAKVGRKTVRLLGADTLPVRPWVAWFKVEPRMGHAPGEGRVPGYDGYCNAWLGGRRHGRWIGIDRIAYFETDVGLHRGGADGDGWTRRVDGWTRLADAHPSDPAHDVRGGLGTMRFKAALSLDCGRTWVESPGAAARDRLGIKPTVHRVSFREGDDFAGYVTSFFNVPQVFGSLPAQARRFIGVDCADVLIAAARTRGHKKIGYTFVEGLWKYASEVVPRLLVRHDRVVPSAVHWSRAADPAPGEVRRGDIIPIGYERRREEYGYRSFAHVAVLYADRSDPSGPAKGAADGLLDPFDLILHVGYPALEIEPLGGQAPATIAVLRWKRRHEPEP